MLAAGRRAFDAVVAMDSLIHYEVDDALDALSRLARGTTAHDGHVRAAHAAARAMHGVGRFFPKTDRAPSIVPVPVPLMVSSAQSRLGPAGWTVGTTRRVSRGFYTSQMMELVRA